MEKIGNVCLNYDYYSGEDMYSDGEIEDVLLDIVKKSTNNSYNDIIFEKKSWPILYHLSNVRENILNWYNFADNAKILEVGSGCGAVTGALLSNNCTVTAIDLSKKRSLINAYRHKESENLEIIVGNFNDIAGGLKAKYDYVTLIGVFEYADCYITEKNAADVFLSKIKDLLNENGKIIIAIENQLGLKYFAGCKEDHVGKFFEGIEGYTTTTGVRTYSKKKITEILARNGFKNMEFYYPYPDYKLPNKIFTDEALPKAWELTDNMRNFDSPRMSLFDESKVWNVILEAGLFPEFSNSFLIVAEK